MLLGLSRKPEETAAVQPLAMSTQRRPQITDDSGVVNRSPSEKALSVQGPGVSNLETSPVDKTAVRKSNRERKRKRLFDESDTENEEDINQVERDAASVSRKSRSRSSRAKKAAPHRTPSPGLSRRLPLRWIEPEDVDIGPVYDTIVIALQPRPTTSDNPPTPENKYSTHESLSISEKLPIPETAPTPEKFPSTETPHHAAKRGQFSGPTTPRSSGPTKGPTSKSKRRPISPDYLQPLESESADHIPQSSARHRKAGDSSSSICDSGSTASPAPTQRTLRAGSISITPPPPPERQESDLKRRRGKSNRHRRKSKTFVSSPPPLDPFMDDGDEDEGFGENSNVEEAVMDNLERSFAELKSRVEKSKDNVPEEPESMSGLDSGVTQSIDGDAASEGFLDPSGTKARRKSALTFGDTDVSDSTPSSTTATASAEPESQDVNLWTTLWDQQPREVNLQLKSNSESGVPLSWLFGS
jgi:hypothetical protein